MGRRFESCRAHHYSMKQTIIKNIATGITKKCDILKKNDNILEVVLEGTTIKITLKKRVKFMWAYLRTWSSRLRVSITI